MAPRPTTQSVEPNDWQTVEPNDWQTVGGETSLPAGKTSTPPQPSGLQRAYEAVGTGYKNVFQGTADVVGDLVRAVSKPGGLKELQKKYPPTHSIWKTLKDAYGSLNPADVRRNPDGSIDWPATIGGSTGKVGALLTMGKVGEDPASKAAKPESPPDITAPKEGLAQKTVRGVVGTGERQTKQFVKEVAPKLELDKQVKTQSKTLLDQVKKAEKDAHATANEKYGIVKQAVGNDPFPIDDVVGSVREAESKFLRGPEAAENVPLFRSLLAKEGSAGEQPLRVSGTEILPTDPGYAAVRQAYEEEGLLQDGKPQTFADLQRYYTGIGKQLADAANARRLSPGVYHALRYVQDAIGNKMQTVADSKGVGSELKDAREYYSKYMKTFHEPSGPSQSGSPVARAVRAVDPDTAAKNFTAGTDKSRRGISMLKEYDPSAATTAEKLTEAQKKLAKIPKRTRGIESMSPEELQTSKEAHYEQFVKKISSAGSWLIPLLGFEAIKAVAGGELPKAVGLARDIPLFYGTRTAVINLLERPGVVEWMTKPTPSDLELLKNLPAQERATAVERLKPVVTEAQRQGKPVSPALVAFVGGAAAAGKRKGVAEALTAPAAK